MRTGQAAVRAPGSERFYYRLGALPHPPRFLHLLFSQLIFPPSVTQMTSDWLAPEGNKDSVLPHVRDTHTCGECVSVYLLPVALTGSAQVFEPQQSVHPVPRLVLVGVSYRHKMEDEEFPTALSVWNDS